MGQFFDFRTAAHREPQRLERLLACYQTFVGHELLNALVGLRGLTRLLDADPTLPQETRALLANVAALAQKADRGSRRVAEIGRLLQEPSFGPLVELTGAVREAAAEASARHPAVLLELTVPDRLPAVPLGRRLLHAVLFQLFANACQAAEAALPCPVEVEVTSEGAGVWLHLRDHGRGMAEAQLAQLGEPFAAGRQPGATGAGLGFFLVRQAAAKWGGAVRVESALGGPTTVSLFLPMQEDVAP